MNHRRRFASHLKEVLGLSTLVVAVVACGGKVAFDGLSQGGGVGGSTSTSGSTSATSSSGKMFVCDAQPPEGQMKVYVCADGLASPCPVTSDPALASLLQSQLSMGATGGSCGPQVVAIPCGPDPTATLCCYDVFVSQVCEGRPFTIDGSARVAEVVGRFDWTREVEPDTSALDATTRATLAAAWTRSALFEHASIASFARFTLELLAVGAPSDLIAAAQRAALDEVRHAEVAFGLASAYAGERRGPGALPMEGGFKGATLASLAASTVLEGCVNETIAALLAAKARDEASDPAVRGALACIAADEARHAELAWRTVAWAVGCGGADVRRAVVEALADVDLGGAAAELEGSPSLLRAHGLLASGDERVERIRILDEVVRPTLLGLLEKFDGPSAATGQARAQC